MGWSEIRGDLTDAPVRADPAAFDTVSRHFGNIGEALRDVRAKVSSLSSGTATDWQGTAAEAFGRMLQNMDEDLRKVPAITDAASNIFADHARQLRALREESDRALARARTRRTELAEAESRASDAWRRLSSIERQIQELERREYSGEDVTVDLTSRRSDEQYTRSAAHAAQGTVDERRHQLEASIGSHGELSERERSLNVTTEQAIYDIHFQDLHDPSNAEKAGDVLGDVLTNPLILLAPLRLAYAAFEAIAEHLPELAWALDTVLDWVGKAIAVVGIVLLCAFLIAGTGGAALALIGVAALAVSSLKFVNTVALWKTGTENPWTGQSKGITDVLSDGISVALAAIGVRANMSGHSRQIFRFPTKAQLEYMKSNVIFGKTVLNRHLDLATAGVDAGKDLLLQHFDGRKIPTPQSLDGATKPMMCPAR